MRIALLNGSPKGKNSASQVILGFVKTVLPDSFDYVSLSLKEPMVEQSILEEITSCATLIWAFPLYVDAIPSHLLPWLLELEKIYSQWDGEQPRVYALINCGFYEADQNEVVLEIMRNWCAKAGLTWGQGIGIGAGGVFAGLKNIPLGKWPFKDLDKALKLFSAHVVAQASGPDLFVNPNFPRFSYKLVGEFGWRRAIKRNGLYVRDLHRKVEWESIESTST